MFPGSHSVQAREEQQTGPDHHGGGEREEGKRATGLERSGHGKERMFDEKGLTVAGPDNSQSQARRVTGIGTRGLRLRATEDKKGRSGPGQSQVTKW